MYILLRTVTLPPCFVLWLYGLCSFCVYCLFFKPFLALLLEFYSILRIVRCLHINPLLDKQSFMCVITMLTSVPADLKLEPDWNPFNLKLKQFLKRDRLCTHKWSGAWCFMVFDWVVLYYTSCPLCICGSSCILKANLEMSISNKLWL